MLFGTVLADVFRADTKRPCSRTLFSGSNRPISNKKTALKDGIFIGAGEGIRLFEPLCNGTRPFDAVAVASCQTRVSLDLRLKTVHRTLFNPRPLSGSNHIHPQKIKTAPFGQSFIFLERAKGFEPSTSTLARSRSTPELHPQR